MLSVSFNGILYRKAGIIDPGKKTAVFIVCGISKEIDPVSYGRVCSSRKIQIHKTIPGIFLICGSFVDT